MFYRTDLVVDKARENECGDVFWRKHSRDFGGGRGVHSEEISGELAGERKLHKLRILVHRVQLVDQFTYKQPNTLKGILVGSCKKSRGKVQTNLYEYTGTCVLLNDNYWSRYIMPHRRLAPLLHK